MKSLFKLSLLMGLVVVGKLNQQRAGLGTQNDRKPVVSAAVAAPPLPIVLAGFVKPVPAATPVRDGRRQHPPAAAPVLSVRFN